MQKSLVKQKLAEGQLVLVPKVCFMDPNIVEMMGLLGFDCIWICNEYKAIDPTTLENMVRAGRATGTECVIRTGANSFDDLARFLSMGANGLMIPHVQTAEHARRAVDRIKYPPLGHRELEDVNADADYGLMPLDEYLKAANDETVVVVQIEDMEAADNVEEIAEVAGIDVLFVGPADLALSLGVPGQVRHPKVLEVIRRVVRACEANHLVCGTPALDPEHCQLLIGQGRPLPHRQFRLAHAAGRFSPEQAILRPTRFHLPARALALVGSRVAETACLSWGRQAQEASANLDGRWMIHAARGTAGQASSGIRAELPRDRRRGRIHFRTEQRFAVPSISSSEQKTWDNSI